jgi:KDO2-lipid IV(A) lauroyltransferase
MKRIQKYIMNISYASQALLIISFLNILKILPYRLRILIGSIIFRFFLSPLTGNKKRIENNLNLVLPDLPESDKKNLIKNCLNNIGMTMFELLSPNDFKLTGQKANILGPGSSLLEKARANSQPVILVSGHFGNYDVVRANLISKGYQLGALYRPMNNPYFNKTYVKNISEIGRPLFPRGKKGMAEMMEFLRDGKLIALLIDQHMQNGEPLKFFGKTAYTATSAAKMALKYNAILMPFFAVRKGNTSRFDLHFEEPIEHSDPVKMTQEFNDRLESRVKANAEQWLWTHKRWKNVI